MSKTRSVVRVTPSRPTLEGAGVRLHRAFAQADPHLDPFLLLDDFSSEDPEDYLAGFPWHPHRGIETITYILAGQVAHGDSLGNQGVIGPGDVQWMTAGSGIIHEEMPRRAPVLQGFQLWANLPKSHKLMPPRYRDVLRDTIPSVRLAPGVEAKVIAGTAGGVSGPVKDIVTDPQYLEVSLAPDAEFRHPIPRGHSAFAYLFAGQVHFSEKGNGPVEARHLVVLGEGEEVRITAGSAGARFLLVSGRPLREPVAWGGPIVMNTQAELRQAFEEYEQGTFIKPR